ncbi:hypothetical protein [Peribacillus sp. SCS-155]|uniref:hypothetical protein n=1 Tax=Peribacillus sedimenti TaxID=3115297 RepID=UPI00390641ED
MEIDCMEYTSACIYADTLTGIHYFVPQSGPVQMDMFFELKPPFSDKEFESIALKTLLHSHKEEPSFHKMTILQRHFNIKSYKKFSENKKYISYGWDIDNGFTVTVWEREKRGSYSYLKDIILGHTFVPEKFTSALKEAIEKSTT